MEESSQSVQYFRFYDDGLVVSVPVVAEEPPLDVATWFHRAFHGAGRGHWELVDGVLSFSETSHGEDDNGDPETIELRWTGRLEVDALTMRVESARHVQTDMRFVFIEAAEGKPKKRAGRR